MGPAKYTHPDIRLIADPAELYREAAEEFARVTAAAARTRGRFAVALSGGSTPRGLYRLLAEDAGWRAKVPWAVGHFFWGDERCVPPDHPDSNYGMAAEALLAHVPVPAQNVHRMEGEDPSPDSAAERYEQSLTEFFRPLPGHFAEFDLVLLGLGPDGHTASLFPGTDLVRERSRSVAAAWVPAVGAHRITLTPPVLNSAACVMFVVSGGEKAGAVRQVLQGEYQPERYPAQVIRPRDGRLIWIIDQPAAGKLAPIR